MINLERAAWVVAVLALACGWGLTRSDMQAAQSDALWRCNAVSSGRDAREACRRAAGAVRAASTH